MKRTYYYIIVFLLCLGVTGCNVDIHPIISGKDEFEDDIDMIWQERDLEPEVEAMVSELNKSGYCNYILKEIDEYGQFCYKDNDNFLNVAHYSDIFTQVIMSHENIEAMTYGFDIISKMLNFEMQEEDKDFLQEEDKDFLQEGLSTVRNFGEFQVVYNENLVMYNNNMTLGEVIIRGESDFDKSPNPEGPCFKYGKLLEMSDNGDGLLVIKAKTGFCRKDIDTVQQNYYTMEDFILNQGGNKYDEIQYTAVSDLYDDGKTKLVSFTIDKSTIDAINNKDISAQKMEEHLKNLWIFPVLEEAIKMQEEYQIINGTGVRKKSL